LYVAKLGQDGHDRGAYVVASGFVDLGFEVTLGALFATPEEVAREAIADDVHVIGVSSLAAGHAVLVPELLHQLRQHGGEQILVVVGGVVPDADVVKLKTAGVSCVFGPGSAITESAGAVLDALADADVQR
jgi:methylmalonyl-CoA mutase